MFNIFKWFQREPEVKSKETLLEEDKPLLHCGYKSCQFFTTNPKGLKIHRARIHKRK